MRSNLIAGVNSTGDVTPVLTDDDGAVYMANKNEYETTYILTDTAAGDTWERAIFRAPAACTVKDVVVVPDSDIGQATHYMTLDVQDKGAVGTGTTSIGSRNVNSTNTIEGMVGVDLVSTDATVASARILSLKKTVSGSGQAWPGGFVQVRYVLD